MTPPPVPPGTRAPSAVPTPIEDESDPTKPVAVPDDASLIERIIEFVAAEAEAHISGSAADSDQLLADLNVRLALLSWDVLDDADGCARYLELAERHPLAARLLLDHALAQESAAALDGAAAVIDRAVADPAERARLLLDVAIAWLYRRGDAQRAAEVARGALELRAAPEVGEELRRLYRLTLELAGDWSELVAALATLAAEGDDDALGEAVALQLDRLDDPAAALDLLATRGDGLARGGHDLRGSRTAFRLATLALEAVRRAGASASGDRLDVRRLLERQLELLVADDNAGREAAALRYELAGLLRQRGELDEAATLLDQLAADGDGAGWGARRALLDRAAVAVASGDWTAAVLTHRELASRPGAGRLAAVYLRRAAELADAHDPTFALDSWRKLAADAPPAVSLGTPTGSLEDEQAERAIERHLFQNAPNDMAQHLEVSAHAGTLRRAWFLRRAAAVAESRAGDLPMAVRLARAATTAAGAGADHHDRADQQRLYRRARERKLLAESYVEAAAELRRDDRDGQRIAATLLCAGAAIDLSRGRLVEAETSFEEAAKRARRDAASRAALAAIYRRGSRWPELARALGELSELTAHDGNRVAALRELGRLQATRLDEPRRARSTLERALAIEPDDVDTIHALAELCDQARDWSNAVELRTRAVEAVDDPARAGVLLMEIGAIESERRRDDAAALRAYERALEMFPDDDPRAVEVLRAQAELHRKHGRSDALLDVLRVELERESDPARRLALVRELGQLSADGGDASSAITAYLEALEISPDDPVALAGLEAAARADGQWDILARAFGNAADTEENLAVLSEALAQLERWGEHAEARRKQIELCAAASERARLATELARVFERHLRDIDGAIRMHQLALDSDPSGADRPELLRLLEEHQRWPELEAAFERELSAVPPEDLERQLGMLLRLGELRRDRLSKPGEAALAYEAVLERQPQHIPTLEALEDLYTRLGRDKDLLRVVEARADATEDMMERAQLQLRIADLKGPRGDVEGAVRAYKAAFKAEPGNRDTFTAMEKLCYKHERWHDAMDLYDTAIQLVEGGTSRAYRLGDLYARRGQVQLQYLHELGEAAASYLRVIELDPDNDTAVKFLESIFSQNDDWAGLITAYEKRARLTRDDDRRLETLRRAARVAGAKLKDPAEAARIYELILKVDPSDREAVDALERYHERAQDWGKLVDVLKLRLASAPAGDAATALLRRIAQICEEGLRDEQRAIEHYLRILEIAPGNKEALEALGRIYESTEQWAEFIDVTRRQIRVTTDRNVKALLYFKCGSVMEAKFGKEEDAIRYYDAAIKTSPSCLPAVHGLRDLYRRREDWPRVIQTLELEVKLWQDDKERAGVFAQIGRIYADRLGQPERAMHYYESALAVDPECLPANKALFEHYFASEKWDRAQPLAQALAQKAMREGDPNERSEFYRKRGIVTRMNGDMRAGAESLIIALEIKPDNLEALDALGDLARAEPLAYDFEATYRELDKIYKRRDDAQSYLARVRVAQAVMKEREGDLDAAELLYAEATNLAPGDFAILSALVELNSNMRRWTHAVDGIVRFLESDPPPPADVRIKALMRQAQIHSEGEMDAHRAAAVLREVVRLDPGHAEAYYALAQELYLQSRHQDALECIDRCIELAAAPGNEILPERLARYYYYKGRIIETSGDSRGATSQYRRAAEYDPGYAPPALALARRAAESGDQRQAETLLINAAHAAMESGGARAAVALQRGLARILLASGDRPAAIEAYRGILAVEPDGAADRVALAEIYAIDDLPKAVAELRKVIDRDIHHAPAYRLLASFYQRSGEIDRAARVLSVMEMLGYADDADRGAAAKARAAQSHTPLRRQLEDELRQQLLITDGARGAFGELFGAIGAELAALFPQPAMGENLAPIQTIDDPSMKVALADVQRIFGVEPEVYIGENVPGGVVIVAHPRRIFVIDEQLLTEQDAARRYLLGWALDGIRAGYALLYHLGRRQRTELGSLLRALLLPEAERSGPTNEFFRALPKRAQKIIERHTGKARDLDPDDWIDAMMATAKRAGLFACDDFMAATRMIARLNGETIGVGADGTVALGAVLGGADLVRFYLADDYHRLREILSNPMPAAGGAAR